jgi:hypothetical protein
MENRREGNAKVTDTKFLGKFLSKNLSLFAFCSLKKRFLNRNNQYEMQRYQRTPNVILTYCDLKNKRVETQRFQASKFGGTVWRRGTSTTRRGGG